MDRYWQETDRNGKNQSKNPVGNFNIFGYFPPKGLTS
jgi:hypothetical protein